MDTVNWPCRSVDAEGLLHKKCWHIIKQCTTCMPGQLPTAQLLKLGDVAALDAGLADSCSSHDTVLGTKSCSISQPDQIEGEEHIL